MSDSIQYIVNDSGVKTSVVVPFNLWERINTDYNRLQKKLEVFLSIQNSLKEIKNSKKQGKELQTLSDFLNIIKPSN